MNNKVLVIMPRKFQNDFGFASKMANKERD